MLITNGEIKGKADQLSLALARIRSRMLNNTT